MIEKIEYTLQALSPMYIGSGLGGAGIKRMLRRRADGTFLIPGSTIKGRLRFYCKEYIENQKIFSQNDILEIFGTPGDRSRGRKTYSFSDLYQEKPEEAYLDLRNGIQISRGAGITKPHALFNTEVMDYINSFKGRIIIHRSEARERSTVLLIIALRMLRRLGGSKTVGLGKCEIPIQNITITRNNEDINVQELLLQYLEDSADEAH